MSLHTVTDSLRNLFDLEIADYFVIDTSGVGNNITGNSFSIRPSLAKSHNINSVVLRESYRAACEFVDLLKEYENLGTVPSVIRAIGEKKYLLEGVVKRYSEGSKRNFNRFKETTGLPMYTPSAEKIGKMLKKLLGKESETLDLLMQRTQEPVQPILNDIGRIVFYALRKGKIRLNNWSNGNAKEVISEAVERAYSNGEHVSIITRNQRFPQIVSSLESFLSRENNKHLKDIHNFLVEGNLSVILGLNGSYFVDYCYADHN